MKILGLVLLMVSLAVALPSPTIVDYQQKSLTIGGVAKFSENIKSVGNWEKVIVICDHAAPQVNCLAGATFNAVNHFELVKRSYNSETSVAVEEWGLIAPTFGEGTVYVATEYVCPSCTFNLTLLQIQGGD